MKALLVERNGQRALVAGIPGQHCSLLALVELRQAKDRWFTRIDVAGSDESCRESVEWRPLAMQVGDVLRLRFVDDLQPDPVEARVSSHQVVQIVPHDRTTELAIPAVGQHLVLQVQVNDEPPQQFSHPCDKWSVVLAIDYVCEGERREAAYDVTLLVEDGGSPRGVHLTPLALDCVITIQVCSSSVSHAWTAIVVHGSRSIG